jgi:hypothetical protein
MNLRQVESVTGRPPNLLRTLAGLEESSGAAKTDDYEGGPELCIVSPTFNERGNVAKLVETWS